MLNPPASAPAAHILEFVYSSGLAQAGDRLVWTALAGGISSDIWCLELPRGKVCIKAALGKLRVAADWHAPRDRNTAEWRWLQYAHAHLPQAVPQPLVHDETRGVLAMAFLEPSLHPVWKQQLLAGQADARTAAAVGSVLGRLHALSAAQPTLASQFDTLENFRALRLDPYLLSCADKFPQVAQPLRALAERTAAISLALVHGDVSPKNILVGPGGPVLLDAETAWYGDPAFDLAFCLNHLLLKCTVHPECTSDYLECAQTLRNAYFEHVNWETVAELEGRAVSLLPALLLARVDGKSPVEYLCEPSSREMIRRFALHGLQHPAKTLAELAQQWHSTLSRQ